MGLCIGREGSKINAGAFVAANVELGCIWELFHWGFIILVSFDMVKQNWKGYTSNCVGYFNVEVIIIVDCPCGVGNLVG